MAYQYVNSYVCSGGTELTIPVRISIGNQYANINEYVGDCHVMTSDRAMTIEYSWSAPYTVYNFDVSIRLQWDYQNTFTGHPTTNYTGYSIYTIPAGTRLKTFFIETYRNTECPCQEMDSPYSEPV